MLQSFWFTEEKWPALLSGGIKEFLARRMQYNSDSAALQTLMGWMWCRVDFVMGKQKGRAEPDQDEASQHLESGKEPDPDEVSYKTVSDKSTRELCRSRATSQEGDENPNVMRDAEPDPDDEATSVHEDIESDADEMLDEPNVDKAPVSLQKNEEPNLDKMREEPDPDEAVGFSQNSAPCEASVDVVSREQKADQDNVLDLEVFDGELIRIQDAAAAATARLQGAIAMLKQQASPSEMATVVQTLFTILR
jgi:hypothetical protein